MKALVIDYDTYLDITELLEGLGIVDIFWNSDSFTIWYN